MTERIHTGLAQVRTADLADVPAIIELGAKLHAEAPRYQDVPYDAQALQERLDGLIGHTNGCIVAAVDDAVVGYLLGFSAPFYFSRDTWAGEVSFYIAKSHRSFRLARLMIRTFEMWAVEQGVREIVLGVSPGIEDARVERLYGLLGYDRCAVEMRKRLPDPRGLPPESRHG